MQRINFISTKKYVSMAIGALCLYSTSANAAIVLDTMGSNIDALRPWWALYDWTEGNGINHGADIAVPFTLSSAVMVTDITTGVIGAGDYTLRISAASNGLPTETFLHSAVVADAPGAQVSKLTGISWYLPSGNYFLTAYAAPNASNGTWRDAGIQGTAPFVIWEHYFGRWVSGGTANMPAVRIEAAAVPEPATAASLLAGLALLALTLRPRSSI